MNVRCPLVLWNLAGEASWTYACGVTGLRERRFAHGLEDRYLAAGGLEIFDLSDPRSPVRIGALEPPREFRGVDVVGNTAYLVDRTFGMVAVDVSVPALPSVIGSVGIDGFSQRIVHHGGKLFVVNDAGIVVTAPQCD